MTTGEGIRRFQMRERMLSIGDDYWIEDESGARAFLVDGKAMRVRDTWILKDADGNDVAEIKERKLSVRDKMKIDLGGRSATVTKRIVGIRDHFKVEVDDEPDLKVHGNVVDHEYEIERDGDKVAEISKKWFRVRDTYGVEVEAGVDPVLILAITVAVDGMTRDVGR
ncbi:MAG: LURP-one-related family protein [Microthrixaceae bacterium]|nr:LURP-one-related family protein [Microthrixaceae bacterium]